MPLFSPPPPPYPHLPSLCCCCRCAIAPSYAAKLVAAQRELQRRRSASHVFAGRHGFITPRDLFRRVLCCAALRCAAGDNSWLLPPLL